MSEPETAISDEPLKAEEAVEPGDRLSAPETSAYSTSGLLVASFSLMISIWVARSTLPVRAITTLTITLLPLVGMVPAVVAVARRPRTWIIAGVLILLHGATLAFSIHAHMTLAR